MERKKPYEFTKLWTMWIVSPIATVERDGLHNWVCVRGDAAIKMVIIRNWKWIYSTFMVVRNFCPQYLRAHVRLVVLGVFTLFVECLWSMVVLFWIFFATSFGLYLLNMQHCVCVRSYIYRVMNHGHAVVVKWRPMNCHNQPRTHRNRSLTSGYSGRMQIEKKSNWKSSRFTKNIYTKIGNFLMWHANAISLNGRRKKHEKKPKRHKIVNASLVGNAGKPNWIHCMHDAYHCVAGNNCKNEREKNAVIFNGQPFVI